MGSKERGLYSQACGDCVSSLNISAFCYIQVSMEDTLRGVSGLHVLQHVVVVSAGILELVPIHHQKEKEKRARNRTLDLPKSPRGATLRNAVSFL